MDFSTSVFKYFLILLLYFRLSVLLLKTVTSRIILGGEEPRERAGGEGWAEKAGMGGAKEFKGKSYVDNVVRWDVCFQRGNYDRSEI